MIVDTGAFHTIISTDYLEQIAVAFSEEDELVGRQFKAKDFTTFKYYL